MAAMTDPGMPGDAALPAQGDLLNAYSAGYTHEDVAQAFGADPPRPDIGEIWGGTHPADATWAPTLSDLSQPGRDAINEGAGPIGELILGAAAGGAVGVAKGLPGAIGSVLGDVSGELAPAAVGRAAQMGVTTTTDGLASAGLGAEVKAVGSTISNVVGNKWVRRGAAGFAGATELKLFQGLTNDPTQWDKDFASQASMVNQGLTDEQNRKNK